MDCPEDVPEVSDTHDVEDSVLKIKELLRGFDTETTEWSHELQEELNNPIKQNLLNRLNVHDQDCEFIGLLSKIDHVDDRADEFNYRQELLNPIQLDQELDFLLHNVETAKNKSSKRMDRLHAGFMKVKTIQKNLVARIIEKIRSEAGLTKLEERIGELNDQITGFQDSLQKKKEKIQRNIRDKTLSADELRKKYEQDIEEKVRNAMSSIDQKSKELSILTTSNEKLKSSYATLQSDLGQLLHDLEQEERNATMVLAAPINPLHRFRASVYRHANSKGIDSNLFTDVSAGKITEELVGDSHKALDEAFARQQELYLQVSETETHILAMRKELTALLQSEEHKALERLKKVCDNLQVKIQSDEQRVKVMAALVNQMQRSEQEAAAHRTTVRKTVLSLAKNTNKPNMLANVRTRSRKSSPGTPSGGDFGDLDDVLPLLRRDCSDKESISMKLHRRLYAQYFNNSGISRSKDKPNSAGMGTVGPTGGMPVASSHYHHDNSDSDNQNERVNSSMSARNGMKPSTTDLPRKRRITAAQSGKIQKIMDMINLQYAKLSSVRPDEIRHILDYRDFEAESWRPESNLSEPHSASNKSSRWDGENSTKLSKSANNSRISGKNNVGLSDNPSPRDHTAMLQSNNISNYSNNNNEEGGERRTVRHTIRPSNSISGESTYAHLRIPTTSSLEDQDDADFYAQNYGIKLALEHLNAFMEILTNGRSSDVNLMPPPRHVSDDLTGMEEQELVTVEGLRANIQRLIKLIRELHFLSTNATTVRKGLQKEVDAKLRECDKLRSELLEEIEGSHWPTAMKAGQYEIEIEDTKHRVKELKRLVKQWDQRVSLKRAQNVRLSQIITNASARKASAAASKLSAVQEFNKRKRSKNNKSPTSVLLPAATASRPEGTRNSPSPPSPYARAGPTEIEEEEEKYTVANKRMSLFDDMSAIYDTAMNQIRQADRGIPYQNAAVIAATLANQSEDMDMNMNMNIKKGVSAVKVFGASQLESHESSMVGEGEEEEGGTNSYDLSTATAMLEESTADVMLGSESTVHGLVEYSGHEEDQQSDGWEDI